MTYASAIPTAHLSPDATQALMASREALRANPLDVSALLRQVALYEEHIEVPEPEPAPIDDEECPPTKRSGARAT